MRAGDRTRRRLLPRRAGERKPGTRLFQQEGEYWTIAYGGAVLRLRDTKGLHCVARLLGRPGERISAPLLLSGPVEAGGEIKADAERARVGHQAHQGRAEENPGTPPLTRAPPHHLHQDRPLLHPTLPIPSSPPPGCFDDAGDTCRSTARRPPSPRMLRDLCQVKASHPRFQRSQLAPGAQRPPLESHEPPKGSATLPFVRGRTARRNRRAPMKVAHISFKGTRVTTAMVVALWGFGVTWSPAPAVGQCCGDCDGDGTVAINELVTSVNRALEGCPADGGARCGADAVVAGTVCMDKYEASVWRVPNPTTTNAGLVKKIQPGKATAADLTAGGATQLGTAGDDYAPCTANGQNCANDIYAVSCRGRRRRHTSPGSRRRKRAPTRASGCRRTRSGRWRRTARRTRGRQRHDGLQHREHGIGAHRLAQRLRVGAWRLRHGGQPGRVGGGLGAALDGVPGWGGFSNDVMCLAGASDDRRTPRRAAVAAATSSAARRAGPLTVLGIGEPTDSSEPSPASGAPASAVHWWACTSLVCCCVPSPQVADFVEDSVHLCGSPVVKFKAGAPGEGRAAHCRRGSSDRRLRDAVVEHLLGEGRRARWCRSRRWWRRRSRSRGRRGRRRRRRPRGAWRAAIAAASVPQTAVSQ